ncbi:MAG TPA: DUF4262 domain-containing protein [Xanthobacteraceae bacterium]|nr:DUF4262 domain-containing protein [Xanthobacteraceae bacterium]
MFTALDADPSKLDEQEQNFVSQIREHGWLGTSVFGDEAGPGFSYTTGFWLNLKFPEVITFSLRREIAHDTFWHIYRTLKGGDGLAIGTPIESIFESGGAALLPVSESRFKDHLGWSRWFYGGDAFRCVQLFWTDPNGFFPWQAGYSAEFIEAQPDLTEGKWSGLRQH